MKSQAVMFKWRILNSSLCAFIDFVAYCVKNLHVFEVCFSVFIGSSGKYSLWFLDSSKLVLHHGGFVS